ncbi:MULTISPECIES: acetate/propionate family kinase [unclassified Modicisalibacter]|uniref:acetate/propionate family kinase n=1 Tax=unclassified Modicisalibacter TaxID=2679913 RepID=UPI001CD01BFE|nr:MULTISPECIES: acetate/propionate family kinase [unclassified Modicisalibacter]MBZ9556873.1 acetate/propionate family kinase [Modicisalibacter sp. R2A 31.J]MBZ9574466.1 acetate/propionate family kinase [Modicisalibacter sp. MOD 31.J]
MSRSPILVINAGSSSLKFALFDADAALARGQIERINDAPRLTLDTGEASAHAFRVEGRGHEAVVAPLLDWVNAVLEGTPLTAVGHRVVHGGRDFAAPRRIDREVIERLKALIPLAPLHQPHALTIIEQLHERWPTLPQVACFDTAFHRTQPWVNQCFALPRRLTDEGILRYGFHGLSYAHTARRLPERLGERGRGRVIVAHLGHGCSLCALRDGRSQATSMGFTALDGLVMGRRAGSLDPGVILYLMQSRGWSAAEVEHMLYHDSGLYGVSGISDDMRDLLESPAPPAREAIELFVQRVIRETGALVALLGGLDALVFTAGVGEHAAPIRQAICAGLGWLGVDIDEAANARHAERLDRGSGPAVAIMAADEEAEIQRSTIDCLDTGSAASC